MPAKPNRQIAVGSKWRGSGSTWTLREIRVPVSTRIAVLTDSAGYTLETSAAGLANFFEYVGFERVDAGDEETALAAVVDGKVD